MTHLFGLMGNIWFSKLLEDSMWMCAPYPTVAVLVEDLRRQRVALLGMLLFRDVSVHPKALLLQHGDVYFLEADSIGLQESHHCLLMLLYLEMERAKIIDKFDQAFLGGNRSCSRMTASREKKMTLKKDRMLDDFSSNKASHGREGQKLLLVLYFKQFCLFTCKHLLF